MALAEQIKKGGPYTKKEQEERRIQVHHLHFEENKSAVKISELLNVHRNTINEDIRYWYSQLANEIKAQDLTAKMIKQIQRMEIQRDRLLDDLEETESFDDKIKLEKFISEIDNRLVQLFSKMISRGVTSLSHTVKLEEIDEEEIRKFVRDLILSNTDYDSKDVYSEDKLKYLYIKKTKCDISQAGNVIEKMMLYGLVLCEQSSGEADYFHLNIYDVSDTYNLAKFAHLRGYVTIEESASVFNKQMDTRREIEREEKQREEKFIAKFGPDKSKWSEEAKELYENFEDPYDAEVTGKEC